MRIRETIAIVIMTLLTAAMMQQDSDATRAYARDAVIQDPVSTSASPERNRPDILAQNPVRSGTNVTVYRLQSAQPLMFTPEFVEQCMDVADEVNPEWAASIRNVCEQNPDEFERFLRHSGRRLIGLVDLKQRDPALYHIKLAELRIESQIRDITQKLRMLNAEGMFGSPEADSLKSELRAAVMDQVAYSLKARGDYLLRLQRHIETLENQLEQDALSFFRTVEDRYQTLVEMP